MTNAATDPYLELKAAFDFFNARLFDGCLRTPVFTLQRKHRTRGYCSHRRFASRITGEVVTEIAMNPDFFATRTIKQTLSTLVHEMAHLWQHDHGNISRNGYHNKEWGAKMKEVGLYPSSTAMPGGKETGQHCSHYIIPGGPFDTSCDELLQSAEMVTWVDRFPPYLPEDDPETPINQPIQKPTGLEENSDDGQAGREEGGDQEDGQAWKLSDLIEPRFGNIETSTTEQQYQQLIDRLKQQLRTTKHKYVCPKCRIQTWGKPNLQVACVPCSNPQHLVALVNVTMPAFAQAIAEAEERMREVSADV